MLEGWIISFYDFFRLRVVNSNFYATRFYDVDIEGKRRNMLRLPLVVRKFGSVRFQQQFGNSYDLIRLPDRAGSR